MASLRRRGHRPPHLRRGDGSLRRPIGWYIGTDRWPDGEFFRFELDDLRLVRAIGKEALR